MTIERFQLFRYSIPFKKPVVFKGRTLTERAGLIVYLKDNQDHEGWGEAAPLPGFSREFLTDAEKQLSSLLPECPGQNLSGSVEKLLSWTDDPTIHPSVRFALESARLQLLAAENKIPLYVLLGGKLDGDVPMIGLLQDKDNTEVIQEAERLFSIGFRDFKIKISSENSDQSLEIVHRLAQTLKGCRLRLDANQSFSFIDAVEFGKKLPAGSIEYIEEPFAGAVPDAAMISDFFSKTKIPVALDESLKDQDPQNFHTAKGVKALILKPSLLGGVRPTLHWLHTAKKNKLTAVVSSGFESGIGLWFLTQLSIVNHCGPAGIDTIKFFEYDLFKKSLDFYQGKISIPLHIFETINIRLDLLTPVCDG